MRVIVKIKSTGETLMVCNLWHLIFSRLFSETFVYSGRLADLKVEINGCNVPLPEEFKNDAR